MYFAQIALVVTLFIMGSLALRAQSRADAHGTAASMDAEWSILRSYEMPLPAGSSTTTTRRGHSITIKSAKAEFIRRADELKDFSAAYPNATQIADARRLELMNLLYATASGEKPQSKRLEKLCREIRADLRIPVRQRYELAAFYECETQQVSQAPDAASRVRMTETILRKLAKEFPDVPAATEALVRLAEDAPESLGTDIAKDVLAMTVSTDVRSRAQHIIARAKIVGQSLDQLLRVSLGSQHGIDARGKIVILYSRSDAGGTVDLFSQWIESSAPDGAMVIAVNLSSRAKDSQAVGKTSTVKLHFVDGAAGQSLARVLSINAPGQIIIADNQGKIITTNGNTDLAGFLKQASR
jgi:hypothetical protein